MTPDFHSALARARSPLIAEIKPNSPKVGALIATRSVAAIAEDYRRAGVPCLSVTTGQWHGGRLEMIGEMRQTGLPVLRKDFITTQRDLEISKDAGASAVLLTCKLMRRKDVLRLANLALGLGLTPFVEVANARELDGLALPENAILAINNRDIALKETDDGGMDQSLALYGLARQGHRGLLVSASGLLCPGDVAAIRCAGFDGVLVGTALLNGPHSPYETTCAFVGAALQQQILFKKAYS